MTWALLWALCSPHWWQSLSYRCLSQITPPTPRLLLPSFVHNSLTHILNTIGFMPAIRDRQRLDIWFLHHLTSLESQVPLQYSGWCCPWAEATPAFSSLWRGIMDGPLRPYLAPLYQPLLSVLIFDFKSQLAPLPCLGYFKHFQILPARQMTGNNHKPVFTFPILTMICELIGNRVSASVLKIKIKYRVVQRKGWKF